MDKDRLHDLAQSGKFIPGIYNYCDRWCERCPLTSKCLNFATTEEDFSDPKSRDISNAAFWDKISDIFKTTMEMILEDADKRGIDLTMTEEESKKFESHEKEIKTASENDICARKAKRYMKMVTAWFEKSEPIFEIKGKELEGKAVMELPGSDPKMELNLISDSTDVIHWYQHQIYVKIMRALHGALEGRFEQEDMEEFPKDSDGNAYSITSTNVQFNVLSVWAPGAPQVNRIVVAGENLITSIFQYALPLGSAEGANWLLAKDAGFTISGSLSNDGFFLAES